ncbi:MAG: preprotein translocase subunit SecE, partial [Christensenellales bacterium]
LNEQVQKENNSVDKVQSKQSPKNKGDEKKDKNYKNRKKPNANANEKRTIGQKAKATVSELKKVTWPSFGQTVKQTGVVIGFVLIFIVILLGLNSLFGWLFNLIVGTV